jgi:putative DNA primase/helicase
MATDFNDLHKISGLDADRDQILSAVNAHDTSPPPPPQAPTYEGDAGESYTLDKVLERFALIHGETKVYDCEQKKVIKKTAFQDLVTRAIFREWIDHASRRTITWEAINDTAEKLPPQHEALLRRFVYIYPTKNVWDKRRRDIVPLEALKALYPRDYAWWMEHPQRSVIEQDDIVFDPTMKADPDLTINTFTGLPLAPLRDSGKDRCYAIRSILSYLCNGDAQVIDWVTRWLAYPLQHVGAKMATALLFHSETHGTGKSMIFADLMPMIYGQYGSVLGQHQLESQYTDWRSRLLYGCFEEVLSRDQKYSHTGTIKHMITGKTQRIEKKFVSGWEEANHMNAAFLSNEFQPFPVEPSDRRMMVVWPRETLPEKYQVMFNRELENGGAEAFLAHLLDYDLRDFHPHTKPILTDAKQRLIDFGLPSWEVFYQEWKEGGLGIPYETCLSSDLYEAYKRFCSRTGDRPLTLTKFSTILSARLQKKKNAHYTLGVQKKQGTFFLVGEQPAGMDESVWLGMCVSAFREELGTSKPDEPF